MFISLFVCARKLRDNAVQALRQAAGAWIRGLRDRARVRQTDRQKRKVIKSKEVFGWTVFEMRLSLRSFRNRLHYTYNFIAVCLFVACTLIMFISVLVRFFFLFRSFCVLLLCGRWCVQNKIKTGDGDGDDNRENNNNSTNNFLLKSVAIEFYDCFLIASLIPMQFENRIKIRANTHETVVCAFEVLLLLRTKKKNENRIATWKWLLTIWQWLMVNPQALYRNQHHDTRASVLRRCRSICSHAPPKPHKFFALINRTSRTVSVLYRTILAPHVLNPMTKWRPIHVCGRHWSFCFDRRLVLSFCVWWWWPLPSLLVQMNAIQWL